VKELLGPDTEAIECEADLFSQPVIHLSVIRGEQVGAG
jgi:hypothetical protein